MKGKKIINLKVGDSVYGIEEDYDDEGYTGKVKYVNKYAAGIVRDDMKTGGGRNRAWEVTKIRNGWGSNCEDGCLYYDIPEKITNWRKRLK